MKTRAAVLREAGRPRPYAVSRPLVIEDLELSGPGEGEVLVQIAAAGLCHSDLSVVDGSRLRPLPMVLGHEASGVVREIGKGVRELREGDHVVFSYVPVCGRCDPCASGRASLCENGARANAAGVLLTGGTRFADAAGRAVNHHLGVSAFSEFTVAACESLVKVDPGVRPEKAALFGCAVMTGVGAVVNTARAAVGDSVVVFGLGGVGLSAILGARATSCTPIIAVDVLESKLAVARRLGATHTFDGSEPDAIERIRTTTGGGAHVALDCTGIPSVLAQAYAATRRGGTTIAIGLPDPAKRIELSPLTLVAEERTLRGSYMGSCVPRRDVPRFVAMYRSGLLPVDLLHSATLSLEGINEALDALASGEAIRQIVAF